MTPTLKKRFGQHHLRSAAACRPSLDFLDLEGERVLEIGGGGGVLTRQLLERAAQVWCWEVDPSWAFTLARRLRGERLRLVVGDALDIDWASLPPELRVAGNLPYNIATPLILDLLRWGRSERSAFLVQREVGERLLARPGDSAYGSLSVAVRAQATPVALGRVGRRDFRPPPKVDGAFVGLLRCESPLADGELDPFLATVRAAFSRRRKTLRNALGQSWGRDRADAVLSALGWPATTRAEALDLDAFVALHRAGAASA